MINRLSSHSGSSNRFHSGKYKLVPLNDFLYTLIPDNDIIYVLIPNNDLTYSLIPSNDLNYGLVPSNDLIYNLIPSDDITNTIIPNNDLLHVLIPNNDLINVLIPNNDITYSVIPNNDGTYILIPNNDITYNILKQRGFRYKITSLYEPPIPGYLTLPDFENNISLLDPNFLGTNDNVSEAFWINAIDGIGNDNSAIFNLFTGNSIPFRLTLCQYGDCVIYTGTTLSYSPQFGSYYYENQNGPIELIESSEGLFENNQDVYVLFESLIPLITPTPTPTSTPTPTPTQTPVGKFVDIDMNNFITYTGGTILNDNYGSTNITLVNSPTYTNGNGCGSNITLNGSDQYLITNTNISSFYTSNSNPTETSVFLWVYITDNGVILDELGQNTLNSGWHDSQIEMVNGSMKFNVWPYGTVITSSVSTPFNNWYYVGFVYSGITLTAYVNGQSAGTTIVGRQAPYQYGNELYYSIGNSEGTTIGDGGWSALKFGRLEIWNGAITSNDVLTNYNNSVNYFICSTPTPTPTSTISETSTPTPTPTPTIEPTSTPTPSPTPSSTPTSTPTPSPTPSSTPTSTPTPTPSPTSTSTPTPTASSTPTPTPTPAPPVTSDPTLQIWYDASDNLVFQPNGNDGTQITQWNDKSAIAHNANPVGNSSTRPTVVYNVQNGKSALYFDQNDDGLSVNMSSSLQSLTGATVIMVFKFNNTTSTPQQIMLGGTRSGGSFSSTNNFDLSLTGTAGYPYRIGMGSGVIISDMSKDTNFHVHTINYNGSAAYNNKLKHRVDGTERGMIVSSEPTSTTSATINELIFGVDSINTSDFSGYIGEILIYTRALTTSEITNTENYLKTKWGIN